MYDVTHWPAFWGLCGALVYASPRLVAVLLSEAAIEPRVVKRAWSQFLIALFFGPVAAQGFGPTIGDWKIATARPEAVELVIGLLVNAVWPVVERFASATFLTWLGDKLSRAGAALGSKK